MLSPKLARVARLVFGIKVPTLDPDLLPLELQVGKYDWRGINVAVTGLAELQSRSLALDVNTIQMIERSFLSTKGNVGGRVEESSHTFVEAEHG